MDEHTSQELAYQNGYAKGKQDAATKWIPVTERLPEQKVHRSSDPDDYWEYQGSDFVLAYTSNGVRIVEFITDRGKSFWVEEGGSSYQDVRYWMPLPSTEGLK